MHDLGGKNLFRKERNLVNVLSSVFPEYDWLPWKFDSCPSIYWTDVNNQRKFIESVAKELKIKDISDWYKVSSNVKK